MWGPTSHGVPHARFVLIVCLVQTQGRVPSEWSDPDKETNHPARPSGLIKRGK